MHLTPRSHLPPPYQHPHLSPTPCQTGSHRPKQGEDTARTWIKDLVSGQHVTTVCALLSTCAFVCLGRKDSRTLIHRVSEHSHSRIPVERDVSQRTTPSQKYLMKNSAAVISRPSEFHCLFNLLKFLETAIFNHYYHGFAKCSFLVRIHSKMGVEMSGWDRAGKTKPFQERKDIILEMHFWK